ncbi:acylphosphatase [Myxococcota bacterium]|nr:acylphosphatase [Myxococcota bacterium]
MADRRAGGGAGDEARLRLVAHGIVQGVYFRASARVQANRLGVRGWVRNRRDGAVEALVQGPRAACERFLEWWRHGPERAQVDRVEVREEPATGELEHFDVLYE